MKTAIEKLTNGEFAEDDLDGMAEVLESTEWRSWGCGWGKLPRAAREAVNAALGEEIEEGSRWDFLITGIVTGVWAVCVRQVAINLQCDTEWFEHAMELVESGEIPATLEAIRAEQSRVKEEFSKGTE